jgi:hypothetical protein
VPRAHPAGILPAGFFLSEFFREMIAGPAGLFVCDTQEAMGRGRGQPEKYFLADL